MVFELYPREIRLSKHTIINNKDELSIYVNEQGNHTNLYMSVYAFTDITNGRPNYDSAIIDKLYLDFDGYDKIDEIKEFSNTLLKCNVKHTIFFSGGGFHIYIYTNKDVILTNKNQAIRNAVYYLIDKYNLHPDMLVVDSSAVARIARIVNTYNFRRKKFCIPLTREDLETGLEHILEKANKKQNPITIYGNKLFNLSKFDCDELKPKVKESKFEIDEELIGDVNKIPLPPCIKCMIKKDMKYRERYLLILWMKENAISKAMCVEFLKQILSSRKFLHCYREERQVCSIYNNKELFFPNCTTILNEGKCPKQGKCEFTNYIYV